MRDCQQRLCSAILVVAGMLSKGYIGPTNSLDLPHYNGNRT